LFNIIAALYKAQTIFGQIFCFANNPSGHKTTKGGPYS